MHYLDESHILLFLLQVAVQLATAPALAGEILSGVVLGPTLLGRLAPDLQLALFPHEAVQATMLETVSWLGVFFLLLASGFHVDVAQALRSGKAALLIGIVGVVFPIAVGVPVFYALDTVHHGPSVDVISFALFVAVASSITAISVVARALGDLGLNKLPIGSLALSACAVNDLFGWLLFTVVMSVATAAEVVPLELATTTLAAIGFVGICILVGSQVIDMAARGIRRTSLNQPAAMQALVVGAGLVCGAFTQWLGIHAILGFFLAGTMAGTGGLGQTDSVLMGLVFVPGGAMEIVVAALALELGLIAPTVFVAIVFAALASSVVAGPLVKWWSRRTGLIAPASSGQPPPPSTRRTPPGTGAA